jgi:NhaA family Na+:H+ antiporter
MSRPEPDSALQRFIHHEATAGLVLVLAAAVAFILTNGGLASAYAAFLHLPVAIRIGSLGFEQHLLHWINDGLMAVFFLLVGLEIKREVLQGALSSVDQIALPAVAALGGMVVPAVIFLLFNLGLDTAVGWAIPAATDIAFALGALALLGTRVPASLKVFLLTLATLDDLGAIIIIALFYTADLSLVSLGLAAGAALILFTMNRLRADHTTPYMLVGLAMWAFVLQSGVHATLAGVVLALSIPLKRRDGSPFLASLEEALHPYVTFLILPLFAFANAGISLADLSLASALAPLPLGIALGLVLGKPVGILLATGLCVASRWVRLPAQASWLQMIGVACLSGIGFTMSLFIGTLAFSDAATIDLVRVGVIVASLVSAALGLALLWLAPAATIRAG